MTPSFPASSPSPSLADRLEALADDWQNLVPAGATRPFPTSELDAFRDGLNALAEEAEAGDSGSWARAVRRLALLSEVWECLTSEPGRGSDAAEVSEFCLGAMRQLAFQQQAGTPGTDDRVSEEILRETDLRWSDYLSPVDPTSADPSLRDEPVSFEEDATAQDDSPALDPRILLKLLSGAGNGGRQSGPGQTARTVPDSWASETPAEPIPPPPLAPAYQGGEKGAAYQEGEKGAARSLNSPPPGEAARPLAFPPLDKGGAGGVLTHTRTVSENRSPGTALGLEIPPLPARIDLDEEMREAFLADASDLFERIERIVLGLPSQDDARQAIQELGRCFHTLKGAAGSVGLKELAALVHELEERLGQADKTVSQSLNEVLHQVVGYLDELIGLLRRGSEAPERTVAASGEVPAAPRAPGAAGPIRVPASRFDELTDVASELIMQGRFWLSQAGSMKAFAATAQVCRNRLLGSLDRMHDLGLGREGRNRPVRIDPRADVPAQLRRLGEQASDLAVLAESAQAAAAAMVDRGDTLVRLSLQLWDSFQSLQVVPIRGLFQRLARVSHEAARVEGRQVEVLRVGEETGVDRAIQEKAFEPLLHVVRNAVSHGFESPADRVKLGKSPTGRITLEARREGNTLLIAVEDDGKGLDDAAIAAKARRLGWLAPDETPS